MPDIVFYLSDVEVSLSCQHEDVFRGLAAIWGGASRPQIPTTRRSHIQVSSSTPYEISCDGKVLVVIQEFADLLPRVELAIYNLLLEWHTAFSIFHAAMLSREKQAIVLAGPSNSGKSSLALQAIRMGWQYHTDEITVTDGEQVWGITRAIQFDATRQEDPIPDFLQGTDCESYRWTHPEIGAMYQPLLTVPPCSARSKPLPHQQATLFILNRDSPRSLDSLSGVQALKHLHRAAFKPPIHDLGSLADGAWILNSANPIAAINSIERSLAAGGPA